MKTFIVTRETPFAYDTQVVFDKRDISNFSTDEMSPIIKQLWRSDPPIGSSNIEYYIQDFPTQDIHLEINISKSDDDKVWVWDVAWSALDYKDNLLKSLVEAGYNEDYMKAAIEALESYNRVMELDG